MIEELHETSPSYIPAGRKYFSGIGAIVLNKIGDYALNSPLIFKSWFDADDNLFCIENEETSLHGYGETYVDALSSLADNLEGWAAGFALHPESEHSSEAVLAKNNIEKHVKLTDVYAEMQKKYGEK